MSSVHCPPSPVYNTSVEQKIRSRNSAKQFQFGSPKLRDLLREKCRLRVREARHANFDGSRSVSKPGANALVSKILRQELADLETDLNHQEQIYAELIDEMNMWFVEEMDNEEEYLINVGDSSIVFCPVCQKDELIQSTDELMECQCGVSGSLQVLAESLMKTIAKHDLKCTQTINFFVDQSSNGNRKFLYAMCENCDFFYSIA